MAVGEFLTWAVQAQSAPAHVARILQTILLKEGVVDVPGNSFKVAQDTGTNMQIKAGSGVVGDLAVVEGDDTAGQGVYVIEAQNATVTRAIAASDPSNPRIDRVVLQNYDNEADSSGLNDADVEVVEGTPAATPSAPALPDSAIPLAEVLVGAGVGAITDANITDVRVNAKTGGAAPGGQLGYAETTSNVGPFTSQTSLASVTVTLPANRRIKLVGAWRSWSTTVANDRLLIELIATSVRMEHLSKNVEAGIANLGGTVVGSFDSGAGGSVTCHISGSRFSGTGSITVIGTAASPISILVEDLGPA